MKESYMPPEWQRHSGTVMIFPNRTGSWGNDLDQAREAFIPVYQEVLKDEKLYLVVNPGQTKTVSEFFTKRAPEILLNSNLQILEIPTDDSWARDITPSFRMDGTAVDFEFNAWGGDFDGLYLDYENDNLFGAEIAKKLGFQPVKPYGKGMATEEAEINPETQNKYEYFVLEGGSIHVDGEGTCMVTEACLLSEGRNPDLSKEEIEEVLKASLGVEKILWLPRGIYEDETNEHVDNVCCFIRPGEVLLSWCEDEADPQYELTQETYEYLLNVTDARGRKLTIHKLLMPHPIYVTEEEANGFTFAKGEDMRKPGERLAGSYVNFLRTNGAILLPQFDDAARDRLAVEKLKELLPELRIVPIPARKFLLGGGNMHCLSHEVPEV